MATSAAASESFRLACLLYVSSCAHQRPETLCLSSKDALEALAGGPSAAPVAGEAELLGGRGQDAALLVVSIMDALEQEHCMMVRLLASSDLAPVGVRLLMVVTPAA